MIEGQGKFKKKGVTFHRAQVVRAERRSEGELRYWASPLSLLGLIYAVGHSGHCLQRAGDVLD